MNRLKISFSALILIMVSFAQVWASDDMYNKDNIRPFVSLGADYRFIDVKDLNTLVHDRMYQITTGSESYGISKDQLVASYGDFTDQGISGTFAFGIEYERMLFSFAGFGMEEQAVLKPSNLTSQTFTYTEVLPDTTYQWASSVTYRDMRLSMYGVDFNFGYKIFPDGSFLNIIPSLAYGVTFIDLTFPANYQYIPYNEDTEQFVHHIENQPYTSIARSLSAEVEGRLRLAGPLHVGGYVGYRSVSFEKFRANRDNSIVWIFGEPSQSADMYYGGVRLTWVWKSNNEKYKIR